MVGELITLPLRVGIRATQLWLRVAEETASVVADATGRLVERAISSGPVDGDARDAESEREEPRPEPDAPNRAPAPARDVPPVEREVSEAFEPVDQAPEAAEPDHVSEEPELVEEVAEPGAEDGAGASLHVREPWDGYERLKADDVIDRLSGADAAELAAVQLYESENKGRATVLQAVERELRISAGSGSQS